MKNHVFLTCKNLWICRTVIAKRALAISVRGQKNHQRNHQKWCQNPCRNPWKIDEKSMLEKVMPNTWKIIQKWAQKGAKNHPKTYQKTIRKKHWKEVVRTTPKARSGSLPQVPLDYLKDSLLEEKQQKNIKNHFAKGEVMKGEVLKRKTAAYANTPWAPSGPERI